MEMGQGRKIGMEEIKDPTHEKGKIRHIKLSPPPPPATRPTNDTVLA